MMLSLTFYKVPNLRIEFESLRNGFLKFLQTFEKVFCL